MKKYSTIFSLVVLTLAAALIVAGCSSDNGNNPAATAVSAVDAMNYAHMNGGSAVVGGQQLNWAASNGPYAYGAWIYAEVNQQNGAGLEPGEEQVPVTMQDVQFVFKGLSGNVTEIVAAIKNYTSDGTDSYTEIGRYAPVNGGVVIPVAYQYLVRYFGPTHYSVWFKILGGHNEQGQVAGSLEILGSVNGQSLNLTKSIEYGTTPQSTPAPIPTPNNQCHQNARAYNARC